jgi:hypothetical protein
MYMRICSLHARGAGLSPRSHQSHQTDGRPEAIFRQGAPDGQTDGADLHEKYDNLYQYTDTAHADSPFKPNSRQT